MEFNNFDKNSFILGVAVGCLGLGVLHIISIFIQ